MERLLGFCGRAVSDRAGQATIVLPIDPFLGFPFDFAHRFPRADLVDDLGFEQACDTLGQCVIIGIHRRFRPKDRSRLRPVARYIRSTDIAIHGRNGGRGFCYPEFFLARSPDPTRRGRTWSAWMRTRAMLLPEGIRVQITRGYDPSCEDVDHKCHVNAAGRGEHTGEVARH